MMFAIFGPNQDQKRARGRRPVVPPLAASAHSTAASKLFAAQGIRSVGIDQILREAGSGEG